MDGGWCKEGSVDFVRVSRIRKLFKTNDIDHVLHITVAYNSVLSYRVTSRFTQSKLLFYHLYAIMFCKFIFVLIYVSFYCYSVNWLLFSIMNDGTPHNLTMALAGRSRNNCICLIIRPARIRQGGYVLAGIILSVCLFICLSVRNFTWKKTIYRVFMKILDKEFTIKFSKSSGFGSGSRNFFEGILPLWDRRNSVCFADNSKSYRRILVKFFEGWDFSLDFGAYPNIIQAFF